MVAVKSRDLSMPYDWLEVAEVYAGAGRHEEALDWAERGVAAFPDHEPRGWTSSSARRTTAPDVTERPSSWRGSASKPGRSWPPINGSPITPPRPVHGRSGDREQSPSYARASAMVLPPLRTAGRAEGRPSSRSVPLTSSRCCSGRATTKLRGGRPSRPEFPIAPGCDLPTSGRTSTRTMPSRSSSAKSSS